MLVVHAPRVSSSLTHRPRVCKEWLGDDSKDNGGGSRFAAEYVNLIEQDVQRANEIWIHLPSKQETLMLENLAGYTRLGSENGNQLVQSGYVRI